MVRAFSHAEVLWSLLSFLPRVERCQSSRYPGITCWIEVNSRGRRHISPRLEASSSSSSSEELGCVSDFQWFQLVPIWILLNWCNRFVKGLISWRDRLCFCNSYCFSAAKTRLCKFSHPGVHSSQARLGMPGWFLALRTYSSPDLCPLRDFLSVPKTLVWYSLFDSESLCDIWSPWGWFLILWNQSAITLFTALRHDLGQFWWLFWWWVHWLCLLCKP